MSELVWIDDLIIKSRFVTNIDLSFRLFYYNLFNITSMSKYYE